MTSAQLTVHLNPRKSLLRCQFDEPEVVWIVEKNDGTADLTCPFKATDENHAKAWIAQPLCTDCKATAYHAKRCHCGAILIGRKWPRG